MRKTLWLALVLGATAVGLVFAGGSEMMKHTVWVVPWDHRGTVRVQPGDVIEVWTKPLPVVPANLESRFRASKEGRGVELVGEALPHKEGTMERLYFFRAFDPGPATLKVDLLGADESVRETFTYSVEVKAADD
jgi:hypothetical protein